LLGWLVGNVHVPWLNGWTDKKAVQNTTHGSVPTMLFSWEWDGQTTEGKRSCTLIFRAMSKKV